MFNENFEVACIHSKKYDFYMFAGGGIKEGEDQVLALKRELEEEIGSSNPEIICEIGSIEEYQDSKYHENHVYHLTSYCFLCKHDGDLVEPIYSEKEMAFEYEPIWIPFKEIIPTFKQNLNNDFFRFGKRELELATAGFELINNKRCTDGISHFKEDL
jgi:8-oxo-dGTP pyrophosphatase MutT (NUDIX family)